jgi:TonB family protein
MQRFSQFAIAGLIGTGLMFGEGNPSSRAQAKASALAPQSQSQSSPLSTTPVDATEVVFKVCSKKTPPPCAKPPRAIFAPNPEYSVEARKANYRGFSKLKVIVGTDGRASNIRAVGHAGIGLDENAIEAVKKWKFDPATYDGKPVPVEITVEVVFHL